MDPPKTGLLSFLNLYAPAIQALASVLSLVVTCVLAFVTWRYVQLTSAIATASTRTVDLHLQAQLSRERQLDVLLDTVEERLKGLPYHESDAEQMRGATTWAGQDLQDLQQLAAAEGHDPGKAVGELVGRLRWLDDQVMQVKNTPAKTGVDWQSSPWSRWREEVIKSRSEIPRIRLRLTNARKGYMPR